MNKKKRAIKKRILIRVKASKSKNKISKNRQKPKVYLKSYTNKIIHKLHEIPQAKQSMISEENTMPILNHHRFNDKPNAFWQDTRMLIYLIIAISVCLGTISFPYFVADKMGSTSLNLITGMAVGGIENFKDTELTAVKESTTTINPLTGNIADGKEFTVEVIAYPYINGIDSQNLQRMNNFFIKLFFDPNELEFKIAQSLINGFTLVTKEVSGMLTIQGNANDPFENVFVFEPNKFVEIKFLAKTKKDNVKITIDKFSAMNSFGVSGSSADIITNYKPSTLTILEKGMDSFIPEYIESTPTYTGSYYWPKMLPKEKKEIQDAWNKLTPEQKSKFASCTPNCQGKQCGTDGCGGFCSNGVSSSTKPGLNGKCQDNKACINNKCVCQPDCFGKTCGDDGCGGLCYAKVCVKEEVPGKLWKNWKEWYMYAIALILLAVLVSLGVVFRKRIKQKLVGAGQFISSTKQTLQNISAPTKETKPEPQIRQQAIKQESISQQSLPPIPRAPPQLVNYINQQIAKGVPKDKIKESLERVGWKKEIIEAGFKEIDR